MLTVNSFSSRFLFAFVLFFISSTIVDAQVAIYEGLHDNNTFESHSINTGLVVGATAGSADVSNGTSSYIIPLQMPAGTNGVSPSLSISYNSQGGNGHLGMGWAISGISTISRGLGTLFHDGRVNPVELSSEDALLLDGARLVEKTEGTYVKEMYDYSTITAQGTAGSSSLWYRLETKHGVIYEYGKDFNSTLKSEDGTKIILWKLSKVIHQDGNYIEFHYEDDNRDHRISQIKYTGNTVTGLLPFNTIDFQYLDRGDYKVATYESESKVNLHYILDKIVISTESAEVMKEYHFTYAEDEVNVFLKQVQEVGSDGNLLNPTIFKYGDAPVDYEYDAIGIHDPTTREIFTGDYNGDGYTDKLEAKVIYEDGRAYHDEYRILTKAPSPNNNNFFFQFVQTLPQLGLINSKGARYNFYSADFTGEGRDDVVYLNSTQLVNTDFRVVHSVDLHKMNSNASGVTIVNIPINSEGTLVFRQDHKAFNTGDFNGDGIIDIILIAATDESQPDYKVYVYYGNISTTLEEITLVGSSSLNFDDWGVKNINTIDINGDGRTELLVTHESTSEIFEFEDFTASSLNGIGTGFPTKYHLMFFGDFNGDRKTDILSRTSLNDNNASWYISRADGNEFVEDNTAFEWIDSPPDVNEDYMGEIVVIGDYNGDGRSDIARGLNDADDFSIQVYYSQGIDFFFDPYDDIQESAELNRSGTNDFNGDGRSDLMNQIGTVLKTLKIKPQGEELLLEKVKNGHGHVSAFGYENMTRVGSVYTRDAMTEHPVNTVRLPMLLPDRLTKDGFNQTRYEYKNAKLHKEGKGFLGFEQITTKVFNDNGMSEDRQYVMHPEHIVMLPTTLIRKKDSAIINTRSITNTYTTYTDALDNISYYTHHVTGTHDDNVYEGRTTTTSTTFDTYGNAIQSSMDINGIELRTTNATFVTANTPVPAVPNSTSTTISRAGAVPYTTSTDYTYTPIGQIQSMTSFPGQTKAVTETYTYNNLGNRESTTISATGLEDRSSSTTYDSKGRYIISSTNALGQASSASYDPKWSKPLSTTGIDGLTTTYDYDGFGRLTTSTAPTGYTISESYNWENSSAIYSKTSTHPGAPDVTNYHDVLDRVIQQTSEGYGLTKNQSTSYDLRGNVSMTVSPTGFTTTTTYDDFNRPINITNDYGTSTISYTYSSGNMITTMTNAAGQVSSQTSDATDKIISSTDYGGTLSFTYHSHGDMAATSDGIHTLVSTAFDEYGRQTSLTDIDAGTTTYEYDALGQLITEISAKGGTTSMTYNEIGQLLEKVEPEGTTVYSYYASGSGASINQLHTLNSTIGGEARSYEYDTYGRVEKLIRSIDGTSYEFNSSYDIYSNLISYTYPSGYSLNYIYDNNGYNTEINDGSKIIFQLISMNALDQMTEYKDILNGGSGITTTLTYNHGFPTSLNCGTSSSGLPINQDYVWDYTTGNLLSRDFGVGINVEEYSYDNLNRLVSFNKQGFPPKTINYAPNGNINDKEEVGSLYTYDDNKIHAVTGIEGADYGSLSMYSQDVSYTNFMQPHIIMEKGNILTYTYDADYQRIKSVLELENGTTESRIYLGDYEIFDDGNEVMELHYINVGRGIHAVIQRIGSNDTYYRTFTDYQGSVIYLEDISSTEEYEFNYDPWGRRRHHILGEYLMEYDGPRWFTRGYTGHEHLEEFQLINMNGRLFDPVIGRMLSPDNHIQFTYNSQNYNRYSYVLNNPLKYTDPSGEFIESILIGAAVGALISTTTNGIINTLNHRPFFDGAGKAAVFGAIGGGVSAGIGSLAGQVAKYSGKGAAAVFQASAHGFSGLIIADIRGGNPVAGFASGAISSVVSSGVSALGGGATAMIISGGVSGGVGSKLSGGGFWNGVSQGLITSGLNHALHSGMLGEGVAVAMVTRKIRHIFGPDAIAGSFDGNIFTLSPWGGGGSIEGVYIVRGPDKGKLIPTGDLAWGVGIDVSVGISVTNYYYSGDISNFRVSMFNGVYTKLNVAFTAGIDIGGSLSVAPQRNNTFILGVTRTIGVGVPSPFGPFNGSYEGGWTFKF